ncbi:Fic family protein, partial [Acinetobacter baumannii]|uniref:Fic family protein n=1 Tax=Acinetobacter baumannii TaxID=470 RepID=UPI001C073F1E
MQNPENVDLDPNMKSFRRQMVNFMKSLKYTQDLNGRLTGDLINIHPFEDGNGRLCRLLISHVLIESRMSLFPVLLSSFHRRGRRHYIQAVTKFEYKPSLF